MEKIIKDKIQSIIGDKGLVQDSKNELYNYYCYYIIFSHWHNPSILGRCVGNIDNMDYWIPKIRNIIPLEIESNFHDSCHVTLYIKKSIKLERELKLKNLKND